MSDADGDIDLLAAAEQERFAHTLLYPLVDLAHSLLPGRGIYRHTVDVAVQMAHNHVLAGHLFQKTAHLLHQLIAHDDPQTVVDLAEIVDIDQQHTEP